MDVRFIKKGDMVLYVPKCLRGTGKELAEGEKGKVVRVGPGGKYVFVNFNYDKPYKGGAPACLPEDLESSTWRPSMTLEEWQGEARRRFGVPEDWKFKCPVCGYVASVKEYRDAGASDSAIGFSCIGRWKAEARGAFEGEGHGPCNYAGGGLFRLNPQPVVGEDGSTHYFFDFA